MIEFTYTYRYSFTSLTGIPSDRDLSKLKMVGVYETWPSEPAELMTWFTRIPIRMPVPERKS